MTYCRRRTISEYNSGDLPKHMVAMLKKDREKLVDRRGSSKVLDEGGSGRVQTLRLFDARSDVYE